MGMKDHSFGEVVLCASDEQWGKQIRKWAIVIRRKCLKADTMSIEVQYSKCTV